MVKWFECDQYVWSIHITINRVTALNLYCKPKNCRNSRTLIFSARQLTSECHFIMTADPLGS